ncbi:CsbD family protein [Smaragdicoccus niigatensis]|uniref:CsbD family protein n=1 Tax=Smaragdicoccus niigatensis TaxID=359359 RepID=UPI00038143B6|nr:CsbD family protein [Smaragdicoccus niigatensis]
MGIAKNMANKAEAAKGSMKKNFGRVTRNRSLQAGGAVDQARGNSKQAGVKLKNTLLSPTRGINRAEVVGAVFGVVLLLAGIFLGMPVITTIGLVLVVAGVVLLVMGSMGRPTFGRRQY